MSRSGEDLGHHDRYRVESSNQSGATCKKRKRYIEVVFWRESEFYVHYSDLLNSSVTRQNINNISNAAGIVRHGLLSILRFLHATATAGVPHPPTMHWASRCWDQDEPWCSLVHTPCATISFYIAGVRDAICVKEFYYLWLVIVNDLRAFVFIVRQLPTTYLHGEIWPSTPVRFFFHIPR